MVRLIYAGVGASLPLIASVLVTAAAATPPRRSPDAAQDDAGRLVEAFVRDLGQAIARQDRKAVAGMVQYPITVVSRSIQIPIANAAALMTHYDAVFTPELRAAIAQTVSGRDRPIVTGDRLTIAGVIAARRVDRSWKVVRITVPTRPNVGEGAVSTRGAGARRVVAATRPAQLSGALQPRQADAYLVWAEKGQLLDVRITGVPGRAIVAHILDAKRKAPLDARARDGARVWTGRVPDSGDYLIEIVRTDRGDGNVLPYVVTVTVR